MIYQTLLRRALKLYRQGYSLNRLADELKTPRSTLVCAMRQSRAFKPRPRGRPKGCHPPERVTPEIAAMRAQTLGKIAAWDRRRELAKDTP